MIKFFRKIRYSLMIEQKAGRYLAYALGEIILVVIGILIALQINNWNQQRIDEKEKEVLLLKLHSEFIENKKAIAQYRLAEDRAINASMALMHLIGTTRKELAKHNLDSLLFESFPSNELAFANNAVNNITQNGRLNLISDDTLNNLLYQWNSLGKILEIRFDKLDLWNNETFIPYLLPFISLKEMDSNANYMWTGKSKVKPDYFPLFQQVEFENLLDNSLWLHQQIIERLKETDVLIEKIIQIASTGSGKLQ